MPLYTSGPRNRGPSAKESGRPRAVAFELRASNVATTAATLAAQFGLRRPRAEVTTVAGGLAIDAPRRRIHLTVGLWRRGRGPR